MPVLVTSAQRSLPRRLVRRLLEEGGEVRAYAHGDATSLRSAGAMVATGEVDDEGRLEAAMESVHTVVHVGGGLLTADVQAQVHDAEVVATAASNAGVARLITLSLPGADPGSTDPLRAAKGRIEAGFAEAAPLSIVVRTSWVDTDAAADAVLAGGLLDVAEEVEVAPVRVDDLLELVVGFDQARSSADGGHLVVAADGPERRHLAGHLRHRDAAHRSLVGRRLPEPAVLATLRATLAGPWTTDATVADAWPLAGVVPRQPGVAG